MIAFTDRARAEEALGPAMQTWKVAQFMMKKDGGVQGFAEPLFLYSDCELAALRVVNQWNEKGVPVNGNILWHYVLEGQQ